MKATKRMRRVSPDDVYTGVMALCLVCCAVLVGSVLLGKPLAEKRAVHAPVLREVTGQTGGPVQPWRPGETGGEEPAPEGEAALSQAGSGYVLTAEYLESVLEGALPAELREGAVRVTLEEREVRVTVTAERGALRDYLERCGGRLSLRQSLGLRLLPRKLEAETAFSLRADEEGLHLSPCGLRLGGKEISLTGLPGEVFSGVDRAVNAVLAESGVQFESCRFTEEGILLE